MAINFYNIIFQSFTVEMNKVHKASTISNQQSVFKRKSMIPFNENVNSYWIFSTFLFVLIVFCSTLCYSFVSKTEIKKAHRINNPQSNSQLEACTSCPQNVVKHDFNFATKFKGIDKHQRLSASNDTTTIDMSMSAEG